MDTFYYLPEFERRAKALAKKYRSFVDDYNAFLDELEQNHPAGQQYLLASYGRARVKAVVLESSPIMCSRRRMILPLR